MTVRCELRSTKPGQNYEPLWDRRPNGRPRVLESDWLIDTNPGFAVSIRDDLKRYMDANDGLFVAALSGECAWHELMGESAQYLKKRFGS
jgi:hypothetical protein